MTGYALPRTLIADDQPDVLLALRLLLKGAGIETEAVHSPEAVLQAVAARDFDLVLLDLNYTRDTTSGQEGLDLIVQLKALDSTLPVVGMTAWGSVELAVDALRRGVNDFVLKPWENARLLQVLRAQIAAGRTRRSEARLQEVRARELAAARNVQQSLLPHALTKIGAGEIVASWRPAREVSGDYFDVLRFTADRAAFCIGDVMGKGVPAALLMANVQALVRAFAHVDAPPREVCAQVNRALCQLDKAERFVTFFYAAFDAAHGRLTYTNAGHNPALLVRRDGAVQRLAQGGLLLGVLPASVYQQDEIALQSGDRLLLFTDGLSEACNAAGEEFGEERLSRLLVAHRKQSAEMLRQEIIAAVAEFSGGHFQDDATLVALAV